MKTVAILCFWIAVLAASRFFFRSEEKKAEEAAALSDFFRTLESEIVVARRPLPEIIDKYENKTLQNIGFTDALRVSPENGVRCLAENSFLPSSVVDRCRAYFADFGKRSPAEESAAVRLASREIARHATEIAARTAEEKKVRAAFVLAVGCILTLLIL